MVPVLPIWIKECARASHFQTLGKGRSKRAVQRIVSAQITIIELCRILQALLASVKSITRPRGGRKVRAA